MSDITDPSKLKVTELRSELQARGLDSKGNKPVLVERLREALEAEKEKDKDPECETPENGQDKNEQDANKHETSNKSNNMQEDDQAELQEVVDKKLDQEGEEKEDIVESSTEDPKQQEPVKDADSTGDLVDKDKESFEDAPVDEVEGEDKMDQDDDIEDKSAVDLIKDDFFNGHTEELQDLEEDDDVKEEAASLPPLKEEEGTGNDVKLETEDDQEKLEGEEDESWDHKRGRKRAGSPIKEEDEATVKKSRSDEVCIVAPAEVVQTTDVVLDWYNSDLSLKIVPETRLSASPHQDKSFAYMWHGARASYGFTKGRICFEVSLEKNMNVPHIEDSEEHPHVVRVGWSVDDCGFTLGEEPRSWGYGGTGKASTDLKFKDYGCQFKAGDIVGAYLDLDAEPVVMSFTVNGDHQGIAYEIRKAEIGDQPLFPHILTKNVRYTVNFGSREDPMAAQLEGYTFVGHVPLADRVQGSQGPTRKDDCEVIMMVGLPACGKTTWVQKYVGENKHLKYNVLGTNELIEKMKIQGVRRKRNYAGRWDQLISSCTKGLNQLLWLSHNRLRNYIIDQVRPMFMQPNEVHDLNGNS